MHPVGLLVCQVVESVADLNVTHHWVSSILVLLTKARLVSERLAHASIHEVELLLEALASGFAAGLLDDGLLRAAQVHLMHFRGEAHLLKIALKLDLVGLPVLLALFALSLLVELVPLVGLSGHHGVVVLALSHLQVGREGALLLLGVLQVFDCQFLLPLLLVLLATLDQVISVARIEVDFLA